MSTIEKRKHVGFIVFAVVALLLIVGLIIGIVWVSNDLVNANQKLHAQGIGPDDNVDGENDRKEPSTTPTPTLPTTTPAGDRPSTMTGTGAVHNAYGNSYRFSAAASDNGLCSGVVTEMIAMKGGSAVDGAIAGVLCQGVANTYSNGIGGGFLMTVYDRPSRKANALIAREQAPGASTEDMFKGSTNKASLYGGLAVAIPTELKGMEEAWKKYGKVKWSELFEPAIQLAVNGVAVSRTLAGHIKDQWELMMPDLKQVYSRPDGSMMEEGDIFKRPRLAQTLLRIAEEGADAFYNGSLSEDIVKDIQDEGGIITLEDLRKASAVWREPVSTKLDHGDFTLYGPPPPSSGAVIQFMMNILDGYEFSKKDISSLDSLILSYHRIVEAMKFGYAKRSRLGDSAFINNTQTLSELLNATHAEELRQKIKDDMTQPLEFYEPSFMADEDHGTSHLSVFGPDGSAVSLTATINTAFGSHIRGKRTGIVFNNEMDDFSTPGLVNFFGFAPSPSNFIVPMKRPMSSMSPSIAVDSNGDVLLIVGGSEGSRIITSTLLTTIRNLWFEQSLKDAIDTPRLHNQLLSNDTFHEDATSKMLVSGLKNKGHTTTPFLGDVENLMGSVQAIRVNCKPCVNCGKVCIDAVCDGRKGGWPDGF